MMDRYFDKNFEVVKAADTRVVILGPIALVSNYMLTTSSGKHLEDTSHAHIVLYCTIFQLVLKIVRISLLHLIVIVIGGNVS